jgi:hypothetical protein
MTVSFWFKATQVDTVGADLFNLGLGGYAVRIKVDEIEWIKRISDGGSGAALNVCQFPVTNHLDGGWHHAAGVNDAGGFTFYLDGIARCTEAPGGAPIYQSNDLWVGRNAGTSDTLDYDGLLDDLRLYDRALSPAEVTALVGGAD